MTDFIDNATIATVTSFSATEIAAQVESSTISGKSTPSSSDGIANTDNATISSVTTRSSSDISNLVDAATFSTTTTLTAVEETTYETLVVSEAYTGLAVTDIVSFVITSTTVTITSTTDVPPPIPDPPVAVTVSTTDYNYDPWIVAYTYDPSAAVTSGTVGSFDDDDGVLDMAGHE